MAVTANTTTTAQISVEVKELDFVTRFEQNWEALREILGIMRPIRKEPGTKLVASKATVTLQSGDVPEGDEVPLSQAVVEPVYYEDITLEKGMLQERSDFFEEVFSIRPIIKQKRIL